MKILLVNYHYFIHGGPDRYFFNIKEILKRDGHTVIPFSFDYAETYDTPYRCYFPAPISGTGTFLIENLKLSTLQKIGYIKKMFINREVEKKFIAVLDNERPDIIYSIYLSSSMLPKILQIAKKKFGIPIVYRLSDFHMFCASYLFYHDEGVCVECLSDLTSAVRNKCVQKSYLASLLRVLQITMIRKQRWYDCVDNFVCPSHVMQSYLLDAGFSPEKVTLLPTFTKDLQGKRTPDAEPHILYFGKLTKEKGVEILLEAYNTVENPKYPLRLIGHCSSDYRSYLLGLLNTRHIAMVTIEDSLQGEAMWQALRDCAFVVHPALWLENLPNTLIEALSAGKPVIASAIGSLTELVSDNVNGYLVTPGDVKALSIAIEAMSTRTDLEAMGKNARLRFVENHTEQAHLDKLMGIFRSVADARKKI